MKTIVIISGFFLLISSLSLSAQQMDPSSKMNSIGQPEMHQVKTSDSHILDRLQKETEDISVMKPLLFIAYLVQDRLELRKSERESVAAARNKENGNR